jgi:hypothetical protein
MKIEAEKRKTEMKALKTIMDKKKAWETLTDEEETKFSEMKKGFWNMQKRGWMMKWGFWDKSFKESNFQRGNKKSNLETESL